MLLYVLSVLGLIPNFQKTKCKRLLSMTMERIKLLEKRRQARLRQLHQDVIKLLKRGKECSIQPCMVRIWKELYLYSVYAKITDYCQFVQSSLNDIAGRRECPCALEEPVAGLCFAASCCADLPELQELRDIFAMKYGKAFVNSAQELQPNCHVDQEFLETLCSKDIPEAQKQALLQDLTMQYIQEQGCDEEATRKPEAFDSFSVEASVDVKEFNQEEGTEEAFRFSEVQEQSEREEIEAVGAVVQATHTDAVCKEDLGSVDLANELAKRKRTLEDRERHRSAFKRAYRRKFWLNRAMEEKKNGGMEHAKTTDRDGGKAGICTDSVHHNANDCITMHMSEDVPPYADGCILQYVQQPTIPHPPLRPPPPLPPKRAPPPLPHLRAESMPISCKEDQAISNMGLPLRCSTMANNYYLEPYASHVHPRLPKYEDLVANFSARKR